MLIPRFGPLQGIKAVSTGVLIAQPWIGTKLAHFGVEVIHIERPQGDTHRFTTPHLKRGKGVQGCDWANEGTNRLSFGLDLKQGKEAELLMALWKISDVWMEASALGTCERMGISPELALAVNPRLVILRVSTYGQYGDEAMLGRPQTFQALLDLMSAFSGEDFTAENLMDFGRSILKQERDLNRKTGLAASHDQLPDFFRRELFPPHNVTFQVEDESLDSLFD